MVPLLERAESEVEVLSMKTIKDLTKTILWTIFIILKERVMSKNKNKNKY